MWLRTRTVVDLAKVLFVLPALFRQDFVVAPREATWEELRAKVFDTDWLVPRASVEELGRSPRGSYDLVTRLEQLLELRFESSAGAGELARASSIGDIVALCAARREAAAEIVSLLARLKRERPDMWARLGPTVSELCRERSFLSSKWDPDDDRPDDGFLVAPPRDLGAARREPFESCEGSKRLVQVATLIHADLVAIRAAENDFRTWPERIGESYEFIRPVPGSYLRGLDPDGQPFAALRVEFEADLPFPFSHYDCDLRMLHRLDERGRLVSDVWSPSEDFYWMAGHDLYLPVLDGAGGWVCILCVRVFGTDLRGVPDGTGDLEAGARAGTGNLKREAERMWRTQAAREPVYSGAVPEFAVHGHR